MRITFLVFGLALLVMYGLVIQPFAQSSVEPLPGKPIVIPTEYTEHRFVALPTTKTGVTLRLFTDSAGGLFIYQEIAEQIGLNLITTGDSENGRPSRMASLPEFAPGKGIPPPLGSEGQHLFIFPRPQDEKTKSLSMRDGMLGQQWFAGRVWTFDYPEKRLLWRSDGDIPGHDKKHEVQLAFKTSSSGKRQANFARIPVEIDGETIDFLLDTGATNVLPPEVVQKIGDGASAERATSFMTFSLFTKLHTRHPEWRALENIKTLTGANMLEVPKITIGGYTVGPVWFTVQPDLAFHNYMAQFMDKPTEGAIGGSALKFFELTVDWPHGLAVFKRPGS